MVTRYQATMPPWLPRRPDNSSGGILPRKRTRAFHGAPHFEHLEGDEVDGAAVIEFPSFEKAKECYDSPAYRGIRHYRMNGAKYIGLLMEGGPLPPELRMPHTKGRSKGQK